MYNLSSNLSDSDLYGLSVITDEEKYFNAVFLSVVMVTTILGNSVALHAFFVTPDLKRATYYFIASLCISDLMVALCSIPIWIADVLLNWKKLTPTLKEFYACVDILCGTWSIMSLAMIGIERYICITFAMHYNQIMTIKRVYIIFCFVAVYSISVTVINLKVNNVGTPYVVKQFAIFTMSYVIPVLIKLFTYGKIFEEAKTQSKQINALRKAGSNINDTDTNGGDTELNSNSNNSLNKSTYSRRRVSWTVSPLVKKRQSTKCSKQVPGEVNQDELRNLDIKDRSKFCSISKIFRKWTFKTEKHKNSTSIQNGVRSCGRKIGKESQQMVLPEKKELLVRHDTDGSVKTVLRPSTTKSNDTNKENVTEEFSNKTDWDKVVSKKSQTIQENTEIYCSMEKRRRSVSCPNSYRNNNNNNNSMRKSLEPNEASDIEIVSSGKKVVNNPAPSPSITKRLCSVSKWSPKSSPLLLRKSFRRSNNTNNRHLQKLRRFKKELRAAKVVGLIMGTFLLCWTPFMVLVLLDALGVVVQMRFVMVAKYLQYTHSAINPVLYVILNKVYRRAILKVVKKVKMHIWC